MNLVVSTVFVRCRRSTASLAACGLAVLIAAGLMAWSAGAWLAEPAAKAAAKGEGPVRELVERGVVESVKSTTVRCEATSPDGASMTIAKIVPDGKVVAQGEVLVTLDSSAWEEEVKRQQEVVADATAAVAQAKDDLATADLAKQEYVKGTYVVQLRSIQNDIFVAENQSRRAARGPEDAPDAGQARPGPAARGRRVRREEDRQRSRPGQGPPRGPREVHQGPDHPAGSTPT